MGPVLPPNTQHFNLTTSVQMKYLSPDHIVTWSICRWCRISRCFTSCVQICDPTNIRLVAINNRQIWPKIGHFFKATQQLLVGSPIWKREVKERYILYNLRIDHVFIRSQLIYLIGAKAAGTVIWNRSPGTSRPKDGWLMSSPDNDLALVTQVGLLGGSWLGLGSSGWFQPGPKPVNPELLLN